MSLPRFFLNKQILGSINAESFDLDLSADDLKHAQVLRLQPGEHIAVIDASQDYFECEIIESSDHLVVTITAHKDQQNPRPAITLAQGLPKGTKFDDIIRHATEVGVDTFIPLETQRSIVHLDSKKAGAKQVRWQEIAKSAAMQSGRNGIPTVELPHTLKELCTTINHFDCVIIFWEEATPEDTIAQALKPLLTLSANDFAQASVLVVVGPEGGLDPQEVSLLLNANPHATVATLGPYILRTETAGLLAPGLVAYELNNHAQRLQVTA